MGETRSCASDRKIFNPSITSGTAQDNRVDSDQVNDYIYNGAGALEKDARGSTFIYNGENKQVEVRNAQNLVGKYFYDGDGRRVKKVLFQNGVASENIIFLYDVAGRLIAEYSTAEVADNQVNYLTYDYLGSPRVITDRDGNVTSRRDFTPFGEEMDTAARTTAGYGGDNVRQKFTGYERDEETDLDFAQARMYNFQHGRFTVPDPLLSSGVVANPQSWNRYAYVRNQPTRRVDPSGLWDWDESMGGLESDAKIRTNVCATETCTAEERRQGRRTKSEADRILAERQRFRDAILFLRSLLPFATGREQARLQNAIDAFGTENDGNGVGIFSSTANPLRDGLALHLPMKRNGRIEHAVYLEAFGGNINDWNFGVAHEGQHIVNANEFIGITVRTLPNLIPRFLLLSLKALRFKPPPQSALRRRELTPGHLSGLCGIQLRRQMT